MSIDYYDQSYPPSLWAPAPEPPAPPTVTATVPNTGVASAAVSLNVTGTGFGPTSVVSVGGTAWPTTYVDATHVTASGSLPATAGTVQVTVTGPGGTSAPFNFTVTAAE